LSTPNNDTVCNKKLCEKNQNNELAKNDSTSIQQTFHQKDFQSSNYLKNQSNRINETEIITNRSLKNNRMICY
jgi:hypothetical protein